MKKQEYFIANLKGFSGCKIKLFFENGDYFVRKISKSPSYNKRLQKQMIKQQYFAENLSTTSVSAPKILKNGFIKKHFFFDMEYVSGAKIIDHVIDANTDELSDISKRLCDIIYIMKRSNKPIELNDFSLKTQKKVGEIYSKMVFRNLDSANLKTLKILAESIENLEECNNMNMTFCHGDLTMENIIYNKKNNTYYLVDFLDNYIDHYWFDIVKLFQDVEGQWYKFRKPNININDIIPKMIFIKKYLNKNILDKPYKKHHYLLLSLNFARILPYAKTGNDINYIMRMIKAFMVRYVEGNKNRSPDLIH